MFDATGPRAASEPIALAGGQSCAVLPGGAVYVVSDLDLDTDGESDPGIRWDTYHQGETAYRYASGKSLSSNKVPYIVIPGGSWSKAHGLKLGNVAIVAANGRVAVAVVGDIGPAAKIGEGSIELHRRLGYERVKAGKIVDVGIDPPVRCVFFPGTGASTMPSISDINTMAAAAWDALVGAAG